MTAAEMHNAVKIKIDKIDSLNYPDLQSAEIDFFLNDSESRFKKQRAFGMNQQRTSFEENQKRTDDLRTIIENADITPDAIDPSQKPNSVLITLPTDYEYAINEEASINGLLCGNQTTIRSDVKPSQTDDYNMMKRDPFNKPEVIDSTYAELRRSVLNGKMEVYIPVDFTLTTYYLRYIRKTQPISLSLSQDSELPEHTHREIVDMAVNSILETIESPRYQSNQIELGRTE
jgi:hypothetical protein